MKLIGALKPPAPRKRIPEWVEDGAARPGPGRKLARDVEALDRGQRA